jgi:hypothetical protein
VVAAQAACARGRSDSRLGDQGTCGAHPKHVAHAREAHPRPPRDLGRVEAQRLVERPCALPSQKEGTCEARVGRRECVWWRRKRACTGEGPTQGLGDRARAERTENMLYMVVTLDVSKLSGWLKSDAPCRVQSKGGRAMHAGRGARLEGVRREGVRRRAAQTACTGKARLEICGGRGTRRAHDKHVAHVCDARGVEAQRPVERRRVLPSQRGACDAGRGAGREAGGR